MGQSNPLRLVATSHSGYHRAPERDVVPARILSILLIRPASLVTGHRQRRSNQTLRGRPSKHCAQSPPNIPGLVRPTTNIEDLLRRCQLAIPENDRLYGNPLASLYNVLQLVWSILYESTEETVLLRGCKRFRVLVSWSSYGGYHRLCLHNHIVYTWLLLLFEVL